ncbi:hypothetical protein [Nesterenkonia sp. F]|uniref:hypothetical protein n=1 Tax=Nesterenkonia sp. F TaxID=795955 RepID=UPI000255D39E|nr:hypothetical protein [Nesterenkonia sp. F]
MTLPGQHDPHAADPQRPAADDAAGGAGGSSGSGRSVIAWAAWSAALIVALVLGGFAVWLVDTKVYTTEALGEQWWEAVQAGEGEVVLGQFDDVPEAAGETGEGEDPRLPAGSLDTLLLDGATLERSAEQIEDLRVVERSGSADLVFTVDGEEHRSRLPMEKADEAWGIFDQWALDPAVLAEVSLSVPGASAGGIGQVEVNGEPVNLQEDTAELAAYAPSVLDVAVDSEWLTGSARQVLALDPQDADGGSGGSSGSGEAGPSEEIEIELEASSAAAEAMHRKVEAYLSSCAEQPVLMPSGCPMGVETPNRVEASTIEWSMPKAQDLTLTFGPDGWSVTGADRMTATVSFTAQDYYSGETLEESHDVTFGLDVEVGASGEDLLVAVTGD